MDRGPARGPYGLLGQEDFAPAFFRLSGINSQIQVAADNCMIKSCAEPAGDADFTAMVKDANGKERLPWQVLRKLAD